MIVRTWEGMVATERLGPYLELMRTRALPDYHRVEGNLGAWCLHRIEGSVARVVMLTLWRDEEAIRRFAGPEPTRARYYPFDQDYLLTRPEHALHFDVLS